MSNALFALVERHLKRPEDAFAQLVLDGKEFLHGGIRRLRPQHRSAGRFDQLTGETKAFTGTKQRPCEKCVDIGLNGDTPGIRLTLKRAASKTRANDQIVHRQ